MELALMTRNFLYLRMTLLTALLPGLLMVYGCAKIPTHEESVAALKDSPVEKNIPAEFAARADQGKVDDGWLKNFKDPKLDALVAEALAKNPGLTISQARVEEARAYVSQAEAKLKPSVGIEGSARDNEYKGVNEKSYFGLAVSWEPDVWGRIRTEVAGQKESELATLADYQFARQSLAAAVANGWFMAITAKLQHRFAQEVVKLQEQNLKLTKARMKIGEGGERDVHLAQSSLASSREAEQIARSAYEASQRSLEVLLGRYPSADLKTADRLVAVPPLIPSGIPSQILERRPDLVAAEREVAKAFYKEKDAKLLHLPRFTFSAGLGVNSLTDAISGLAAGVFAPLYTGGAIEAEVAKATAEQKGAIAAYAQKALQAFKEVETALSNEDALAREEEYGRTMVKENKIAYEQTKKRYEIGEDTMFDVLNIQQQWIGAQVSALDVASKRLANRVALHLALGGSFDNTPATAAQVPQAAKQ
jgi:NodT family efflux transporter outer membrane factor (OMF) lipoprotein